MFMMESSIYGMFHERSPLRAIPSKKIKNIYSF